MPAAWASVPIGTFERSAQQRSCQLVTIIDEPGVGKSRLCAELLQHIEEGSRGRHLFLEGHRPGVC